MVSKSASVSFTENPFTDRRSSIVAQYGEGAEQYGHSASAYRRRSVVNSVSAAPPDTLVQKDRQFSTVAQNNADFNEMSTEAEEQAKKQAAMGLWQGLKTYPQAAAWSVLLASTIIMEGYDTSLIGSLFAYQTFAKKYAGQLVDGKYQIPTAWQTGLQNGSAVGSILGLMLNGYIAEWFGYKKTMIGALMLMNAAIFLPFFAPNVTVLLIGQCISGVPWGMFQTLAITYASEVCPTALRAYLSMFCNICWVIGQILASGVLRGMLSNPTEWSYRIPLALQWAWPVPIALGVLFAPESPYWLVRANRLDDAMASVRRLQSASESEASVAATVSMIRLTNEQEKAMQDGTSYADCFRGVDLRRTEVSCVTWICQNMCGAAFMGYSTYFYEQAGLSASNSFTFTMIQYIIGFVGTIVAWSLIAHFGRRTLYIAGLAALCVLLLAIGGLGFSSAGGAKWAVGSLLLVFALVYNCTVGPVCYAIVAETSSTRLRQKTVVLARTSYNLCGLLNNSLLPLQLNPLAWGWGAKAGLFWAGVCALCVLWCALRLVETSGRSYAELNLLFENRVPAWRFASTKVQAFRSESFAVARVEGDEVSVQSEKV